MAFLGRLYRADVHHCENTQIPLMETFLCGAVAGLSSDSSHSSIRRVCGVVIVVFAVVIATLVLVAMVVVRVIAA